MAMEMFPDLGMSGWTMEGFRKEVLEYVFLDLSFFFLAQSVKLGNPVYSRNSFPGLNFYEF